MTVAAPLIVFGRARVLGLVRRASILTGIPEQHICNRLNRDPDVSLTRFAVMRIAKEGGRTNSQIGRVLGGMHPSTVGHGVWRSHAIETADADFAELLRLLRDDGGEKRCHACGRALLSEVPMPPNATVIFAGTAIRRDALPSFPRAGAV